MTVDMEYTHLGTTGLEVSRFCLGCMNFGTEADWMINDTDEAIEVIDTARDLGINFFDTANTYSNGESEEILGQAIQEYDREEIAVASKVYFPATESPGPNQQGLSRKHILEQVEDSLDRLGTDYLDLYQIHRWDDSVPIEETLSALDTLVEDGRVRYIGASTMASWKFMKALATSDIEDYERFACMQPEYSLTKRHEEANVLPLCADQEIGVIPWSPLAGGFLTGKYSRSDGPDGARMAEDESTPEERWSEEEWAVLDTVREIADERDRTPAQVSLSWLLHKDVVDAPIIGPRSTDHLEENVAALDVELSDDELERLEAPIDPMWSAEYV